jgi:hypothetical protein
MDVELTRDLYLFGRDKGHVLLDDLKTRRLRRVDVRW